jgi:hypothetical protein
MIPVEEIKLITKFIQDEETSSQLQNWKEANFIID